MSAPILNEDIILKETHNVVLNDNVIYEIIKQLNIDRFNWLFVNKYWSNVTVSILWKNPFQLCKTNKGFHLIRTYITCFNKNERKKLDSFFKTRCKDRRSINDYVVHDYYPKPFFEYGKYLNELKPREFDKLTYAWFKVIRSRGLENLKIRDPYTKFKICFMRSIMRQCQKLDHMDWNLLLTDKYLLETMQSKVMNLKNLTLYYCNPVRTYDSDDDSDSDDSDSKVTKVINHFKNYTQNLSVLKFDHQYNDINKEYYYGRKGYDRNEYVSCLGFINALVESQRGIRSFIFNYNCDKYFGLITSILQSQSNSLTKVVLGDVDFNKLSFDSLENCVNLESLGLKFSKGLELERIDHYTVFKNLKTLELSLNKWSSKITALIIRKAGDSLTSLTIGERIVGHTINDDTLTSLTEYCLKINSLSISHISTKRFLKLFSHIKDLKLNTLKIYQIEDTIIKSKSLLKYIDQNSLPEFGMKIRDDYWNYYDNHYERFKNLLEKHNTKLVLYNPFSCVENEKIANFRLDDDLDDDDVDDDDDD